MKVREQGGNAAHRYLAVEGRHMAASWSPESAKAKLRQMLAFSRRVAAGVPVEDAGR